MGDLGGGTTTMLSKECKKCKLKDFCELLYLDVQKGEYVYCPDGSKHKVGGKG